MTSTVLLSKLEYLESDSEFQIQWLTWALLWLHSVLHQQVVCKYLLMKNKITPRSLWGNMLPIQLNKIYLIYILEVYVYNLHTHNLRFIFFYYINLTTVSLYMNLLNHLMRVYHYRKIVYF